MLRAGWAFLFLAVTASTAQADALDSFCRTVRYPSNVAICSDPELRALAIERQQVFNRDRSALDPARQRRLLADQNDWVRTYPETCGIDRRMTPTLPLSSSIQQCMAAAGRARIAYLQDYPSGPPVASSSPPAATLAPVVASSAPSLPKFDQFPTPVYFGPIGRLDLSSPEAFSFRSRLREGSRQAVNFAGHYQLVEWGCGTECGTGATIDVLNGHVAFLPEVTVNGMESALDANFRIFEFRPNSRLIVLSGQSDVGQPLGAHFDLWDGSNLQEIATVPFVQSPGAAPANVASLETPSGAANIGPSSPASTIEAGSASTGAPIGIPLEVEGGTLAVPVQINGVITLKFIVDSGAADVSIPADVVLTLVRTGTLTSSDFTGQQTYTLADGSTVPSMTFTIRTLKVGEVTLQNVRGSIANIKGSLLLGQTFLNRFKAWSIDNEKQVLLLTAKDD
jgi:uncharacterized protein